MLKMAYCEREALGFYAEVFGGELSLHTYEDLGRSDGSPGAIAHGVLAGVVALAGSDAATGEKSVRFKGIMLSLLGTAEPAVLHEWFDRLVIEAGSLTRCPRGLGMLRMDRSSIVTGFTGSSGTSLNRERRTVAGTVGDRAQACAPSNRRLADDAMHRAIVPSDWTMAMLLNHLAFDNEMFWIWPCLVPIPEQSAPLITAGHPTR